jgi:hypothetical protein
MKAPRVYCRVSACVNNFTAAGAGVVGFAICCCALILSVKSRIILLKRMILIVLKFFILS